MSFRPISSTIKLAKFGIHILKSLSGNVQDSFAFAEEIVEQDSDFFWEALTLILFILTSCLKRLLTSVLIHFLKKWKKVEILSK